MPKYQIDQIDQKILSFLVKNARKPFLEIARECGVSGAAIHQRVKKMENLGIITGPRLLVKPQTLGLNVCAYVGVSLSQANQYPSVIEALKNIPEVVECHYTTGGFDMFIKIYARNNHHLLNIIHDKLQPLGLSRSETIISFNAIIDRQLPIGELPVEDENDAVDEYGEDE